MKYEFLRKFVDAPEVFSMGFLERSGQYVLAEGWPEIK